jgi:dolichol-phosphate mannosyltransferase
MKERTLVICPVYNEENTLLKFYSSLREHYTEDVLFVDDGSSDNSGDFLLSVEGKKTFLLRHPKRCGYGSALKTGFHFSLEKGYKKIVTIDVDLQHDPRHISAFLSELEEREVVLGSRYVRIGGCADVPRERLLINRYIAALLKEIFGINFTDPFCGFRGYRNSFLNKAHFIEKSYGFGLEVILEVIRTKAAFSEIPIEVIYLDYSRMFLDGLDSPERRLLHYLEVISRKRGEIYEGKKILSSKSAS